MFKTNFQAPAKHAGAFYFWIMSSSNIISIKDLHALYMACGQQIGTDTRKIEKGSMFFALKGERFNANSFAAQAIEQGCAYAVVDEPAYANGHNILLVQDVLSALQELARFHRRTLSVPVISITGSNGKTTNKELIHAVLSEKYNTLATKGNLNNHIGVPLTLLSITAQHEIAIIEMGANHQGEIDFLSRIAMPGYGLITNIGKAHLEGFGGEEGVKKGKSELYRYIGEAGGKIFVNGDDATLMELAKSNDKITFGLAGRGYDVSGASYERSEFVEMSWAAKPGTPKEAEAIKTHMFGQYNFINLLCAACIGHYFGVEKTKIDKALSLYVPEMNRSQVVKTAHNTVILDAYNANPTSMRAAIENFATQKNQDKALFLGDMLELGDYAKAEHLAILKLVSQHEFKRVILVGPLFLECRESYPGYHYFKDTGEAQAYLSGHPLRHSLVLIKGSRGIRLEKLLDSI